MGVNTVQFSDSNGQLTGTEQGGQPGSTETTPQGQENTSTPLDMDALSNILDQKIQKSVDRAFQGVMSSSAKMEARIKSEIDERLSLLKQSGVQLDANQQKAIADATRNQIVNAQQTNQGNSQDVNDQAQGNTSTNANDATRVNQQADEIMRLAGVDLDTSDPEAKMIDQSDGTKYLQSLKAALVAKRNRLAGNIQDDPTGRVPMIGGGGRTSNPIQGINDMNTLYEMSLHKRK